MKFLKKIFSKKEKKYKLILTEDEMFILGPIILINIDEWRKDFKENGYNDKAKKFYEREMKIRWKMIVKIKKTQGIYRYWKKWDRKNRKMLKECDLK